jgi:hypothetical protein
MRKTPLYLVLTVAGLTLALSSCSQPVSPLDTASATQLAAVSQTGDQMLFGMMNPSSSYTPASLGSTALAAAGLSPQAVATCTNATYTKTGWGVDTDHDGIPDHATTDYACATTGVTLSGTFTVDDRAGQDTGYKATIKNFELTVDSGGQTYTLSAGASFDLTGSPTSTYALDFAFDVNAAFPNASGSLSVTGHPTYTPDTSSSPFAAGTFTLDGQASYDDTNGHHYVVTRKGSGLHFDKANTSCTTDFDGGTVTYSDSKGNALKLVYTCPSVSATFNGVTLP